MPSPASSLLSYLRVVAAAWRNDPRSDAELLIRFAQSHDEAAFATLVCRHGPLVWRTCLGILGNTSDAEDAFQVVFLALARKAGRVTIESPAGWLHRVARQTAMNVRSKSRRSQELERRLRVVSQPELEGSPGQTELCTVLDEELAGLPERLRIPLVLRYLEGKTLEDVARIVGCCRRVLGKRLTRGEAILRERLEKRGLTVGIGSVAVLLGDIGGAPAVPLRLIGSTARAAVAFRWDTLTGGTAEEAQAMLCALAKGMMIRKSLWVVLACLCSLGIGLVAWQASVGRSNAVESPELSASPEATVKPGSERVDRDGDALPTGALARLGTLRLRHVGNVYLGYGEADLVVFSRDGKALITAGGVNPIQLWDAATGKPLRSFGDGRKNPTRSIVPSPDGNTLATVHSGDTVFLWKVATGKCLPQLKPVDPDSLGARIIALAFSQDGQTLLSAGRDKHIRVWEVATGKEVRDQPLLNPPNDGLYGVSEARFLPDGKTYAELHDAESNLSIYLWETATGKRLRHLTLEKVKSSTGSRSLIWAFSPDGCFLAVGSYTNDKKSSNGTVHLWEVATGKEVRQLAPDEMGTSSVAFSPDGKILATGSRFGPIHLWEAATGKEARCCQDYRAYVVALAFSPDGSTLASLAGKNDHTARLWEVASGKERLRPSRGHAGPILSVAFSSDGKSLISGGRDGLVGFWDTQTGQARRPLLRAGDFQALAALPADGKTFLTIGNSFSPQGQDLLAAAISTPTQVCVWDRTTGQKLRQFPGLDGCAQSLTLSPDGKFLVLSFWHCVSLMEVATGNIIRQFSDDMGNFKYAALSSNGKTLAVCLGGSRVARSVHFYATANGKNLGSIKAFEEEAWSLALSPDGQTLAVGGSDERDRTMVRLWRLRTDKKGWEEAGTLVGHRGPIWALTFSPDGKTLASTGRDGTLRVWEVATGKERCRFTGHRGEVWCVAFAPDGRRLAAGSNDTTILVWDVTGRLQSGQLSSVKLSAKEVKSLWVDLTSVDAVRAGQAVWTLAAAPAQALPLLREYLRPVAPAGPHIVRLIADLDSATFAVRQKAADELGKMEEVAEPALRRALAKAASLEMRRRLEQLLEPLEKKFPLSAEKLRSQRALEVLGQIGTPEARQLLEELAQGVPGAPLTREAQATLKWLGTRVKATDP